MWRREGRCGIGGGCSGVGVTCDRGGGDSGVSDGDDGVAMTAAATTMRQ